MSIRSFRSEYVSKFVKAILDGDKEGAKKLLLELKNKYPFVITRDINKAKQWLKDNSRGTERFGLIASSNADRLKPFGIYVELKIDAKNWFLREMINRGKFRCIKANHCGKCNKKTINNFKIYCDFNIINIFAIE